MAFHLKKKTNVVERHFSRRFQVALIGEGLLVGLLGGGVVTLYRLCLSFAEEQMRSITESIAGNWPYMALWFSVLLILMVAVSLLMKFEPYTAGSGIPQTNAEVMGSADMPWYRVLPIKFIQGVLVAFGGLSMGREGPSVQLGAVSGKAVSKILKRKRGEERLLVTCGAAAGMSAAFHAPLTGTLFAIEEIQKEFHAPLIISAMTASVAADFLVSNVLGMKPVLKLPYVAPLPHVDFAFVLIVGFTCGLLGALHNKGMFFAQGLYKKITKFVPFSRLIIPFMLAGIMAFTWPDLLCGGDAIIEKIKEPATLTELMVIGLLLGKYLFTTTCFAAGTPGGTLFPMVVMGTLVGTLFSLVATHIFGIPMAYAPNFIAMGVAGIFAGAIRAPVTGVVLIFELTGSLEALMAMSAVAIVSYVTANILRVDPFYEHLLAEFLASQQGESKPTLDSGEKILHEFTIGQGSAVEGKMLQDIPWPDKVRVVTIDRAGLEIIPTGQTELMALDKILVIYDELYESDVMIKLNVMTDSSV